MEDEFAALDAALESIAEQYELEPPQAETDALADLDAFIGEEEAPPVPAFDAFAGDTEPAVPEFDDYAGYGLALDGMHAHAVRDEASRESDPLATVRGVNLSSAIDEYLDQAAPPPPRPVQAAAARPPAAVRPQAPAEAPWGDSTLRYADSAAAQQQYASAATMRSAGCAQAATTTAYTGILDPVHIEFDLGNPPDEEKAGFKLPVLVEGEKVLALTVCCLDGREEHIDANPSWTVQQLLWTMGSRLTVWQIAFFALSETDLHADDPDRWLDVSSTLQAEGITSASKLVFKIKWFKYPKKLRDPAAVYYFYIQTKAHVINGAMEVSEAMAIRLAALQLVIKQGSYRPQDMRRGFLGREMSQWLPEAHLKLMAERGLDHGAVEQRIFAANEFLRDMTMSEAIFSYLKTTKDLPLYGSTIFNVTLNGEPRVVGVAEDGILLSQESASKLQFFTPTGNVVRRPKYEFTAYEDITKVALNGNEVTVVILSDTDAATHHFTLLAGAALSMVELMCGYRRMLEAYTPLSRTFEYPIPPKIPHPALYAKPVKRKVLAYQMSRAEVVRNAYLILCKERNIAYHPPLVRRLDRCIDNGENMDTLDLAGLRWGKDRLSLVLDALVKARTYDYVENEDFSENMMIKLLDLSANNVLEKGFFGELVLYFETLSKHPYELRGVSFHHCGLTDKAIDHLRPALTKLKMIERGDFSKNPLKADGIKKVLHSMRDANSSFQELNLSGTTIDKSSMGLIGAMVDKNTHLTRLNLSECGITDLGVLFLLKGLVNHPHIKALNMSGNKLGSSKASSDLFIWASRTKTLEELRMGRTDMPSKSSKAVAKLLEDPACTLKCLDISGNDYGTKGLKLVLEALSQNAILEHVYLDSLNITEKNYEPVCRFVRKAGSKLVHFSLQGTPLGKKGMADVLKELGECQKLTSVALGRGPFLGRANGSALADMLRKSTSLEKLVLSGATFDKDSWTCVCRALIGTKALRRVELDDINATKVALGELREALQQVPNVREVTLRRTNLGAESLLSFLDVLNSGTNSGLNMLDCRGNPAVANLQNHKKYGQPLLRILESVYLKLRLDPGKK